MNIFNIYISGVGGQGIGLLSEVILRAADQAHLKVRGVDTHGLAQRGGMVESFVRIGEETFSPLIRKNCADLAISLERHEAMRAINQYLKINGTLIYYDTVWQPLDVRLGENKEVKNENIKKISEINKIKTFTVIKKDLGDARMQNVVILAYLSKEKLIPNISKENYINALQELLPPSVLEINLQLFNELA